MNQAAIAKLRLLWGEYSIVTDFAAMGKLVRSSFTLIEFSKAPNVLDELERMTNELQRYIPLMGLEEFLYCTRAIQYARRQIQNRRGKRYALGLSRELSAADRALICDSGPANDRALPGEGSQDADSALDVDDALDDDDP